MRHIPTTSGNCVVINLENVSWVKLYSNLPSFNYRYAMCPQDQPEPEQANETTETSPNSSSKLEKAAVGSFLPPWPTWNSVNLAACVDHKAMSDEVERLHQVCDEGPLYTWFLSNEQTSESKSQNKK